MNRSQNRFFINYCCRIDCSCDAKVSHFHLTGFSQKNVMRLNVAMNNTILMGCFKCAADFNSNTYSHIDRYTAVILNILFKGHPFDILHNNIMYSLIIPNIIYPHNIRMCKFPCRLRFMSKTYNEIIVFCKTAMKHFYSNYPIK